MDRPIEAEEVKTKEKIVMPVTPTNSRLKKMGKLSREENIEKSEEAVIIEERGGAQEHHN